MLARYLFADELTYIKVCINSFIDLINNEQISTFERAIVFMIASFKTLMDTVY